MKNFVKVSAILILPLCSIDIYADNVWTGPYAGVVGGHTWVNSSMSIAGNGEWLNRPDLNPALDQINQYIGTPFNLNGFLGGVEGGYNYQVDNYVVGVEMDFEYQDIGQSRQSGFVPLAPLELIGDTVAYNNSVRSEWISTVRSRLGYSVGDFLGFITGGLAITDFKYTSGFNIQEFGGIYNVRGVSSQVLTGWTIGGGVEHKFTSDLNLKAEYLYTCFTNIGGVNTLMSGDHDIASVGYTQAHNVADFTQHIARIGLNYRF